MSAVDHLRALSRGDRPADEGLLGNARCEWRGVEILGEEALLGLFAREPFDPGDEVLFLETAQNAALVGASGAIVADLYGGRIGRLWRLGAGEPGLLEPAVDVAFDPDMSQARCDLLLRSEDHPTIGDSPAGGIAEATRDLLDRLHKEGALRARAFVVRAFGDGRGAAALLAIYALSNETSRRSRFFYAVVTTRPAGEQTFAVLDDPLVRPWSPRL